MLPWIHPCTYVFLLLQMVKSRFGFGIFKTKIKWGCLDAARWFPCFFLNLCCRVVCLGSNTNSCLEESSTLGKMRQTLVPT